jgi:CheY-like chemotaxis protein
VIDRTVRIANHELQRRARFERGPIDVPDVCGSAARVGQVVLNILLNAAHSIAPGAAESNVVRIAAAVTSDQKVRISVSDTGRGIDRSLLGRIFDPFITTKPLGEGTGLGLYVCHNIVTALGGAIWVESEIGKGSTFHIDLPIYKPSGESAAPTTPSRPTKERKKQLRLLVVDDEPSIAAFIRHALAPHQVATVGSGEEAIVALDARTFDGVICDVVMSGVTGVQVYEHVKTKHPGLSRRFLFITGAALRDLAPEVSRYDVPVLYKPFSLRELLDAVHQMVDN